MQLWPSPLGHCPFSSGEFEQVHLLSEPQCSHVLGGGGWGQTTFSVGGSWRLQGAPVGEKASYTYMVLLLNNRITP